MSVEKNITEEANENLPNSDAVQAKPELPNTEQEIANSDSAAESMNKSTEDIAEPVESKETETVESTKEPVAESPEESQDTHVPESENFQEQVEAVPGDAIESNEETIESIVEENAEKPATATDPTDESKDVDTNPKVDATTGEDESKQSTVSEESSADTEGASKHSDEEEADEVIEKIDFQSLNKEELLAHISEISRNFDPAKPNQSINQIADAFNAIISSEKEEALKKFVADGEKEEDFAFFAGEEKAKFDEYYKIIKEKRHHHYKSLDKQKDENLKLKNQLLERLRDVVDNEESSSINALKKLQEEWKAIGPVHPQHNRTLWANYHALLDRFYDHRSIYFELKDLDRKKNLEAKLELCEKAESLDKEESLNMAIKKLNELHDEFKHIGPVPREDQENLWNRFKAASDTVYSKRKEYTAELIQQLNENLTKKLAIVSEVESFTSFNSDKISDWNSKTKELQELQKKWESVGGMPREKAKEVNKKFWGSFKKFFHNKSAFFKTLDSQRDSNLEKKQILLEKAEQLKDSQEWDKTSNEFIKLQNEWREIGPVPEKVRNEVYKKFKAACDTFFNNRRGHNKELESKYGNNLTQKEGICEQLNELAKSSPIDTEKVYELQDAFNAIGFVPRKAIKKIQAKYKKSIQTLLDHADNMEQDELDTFKATLNINNVRSGPNADAKIERQEYTLRRKISHLENDLSTWKNNISFFSNSKNAHDLLKDFEQKIEDAEGKLSKLKSELKVLQTM